MLMGKSAVAMVFISLLLLIYVIIDPFIQLTPQLLLMVGITGDVAIIVWVILWTAIMFVDLYLWSGFKIVKEWERVPVLRLGKYVGLLKSGFVHIWKGFESYVYTVDLRTNALVVRSEKTLTKDNVPVTVDAIVYWKVKDPEKVVLNIRDYPSMVSFVSQTSMREVIGEMDLDHLIAEREKVGNRLRKIIDDKTEEWGVMVISVEIRDIIIPPELQDAMSRQAQAEREKRARVILASAEKEAAQQFLEAAKIYAANNEAMALRWMNILYELGISGKGNLIFVPSWMPEMKFGTFSTMGMMELAKKMKKKNEESQ